MKLAGARPVRRRQRRRRRRVFAASSSQQSPLHKRVHAVGSLNSISTWLIDLKVRNKSSLVALPNAPALAEADMAHFVFLAIASISPSRTAARCPSLSLTRHSFRTRSPRAPHEWYPTQSQVSRLRARWQRRQQWPLHGHNRHHCRRLWVCPRPCPDAFPMAAACKMLSVEGNRAATTRSRTRPPSSRAATSCLLEWTQRSKQAHHMGRWLDVWTHAVRKQCCVTAHEREKHERIHRRVNGGEYITVPRQ